MDDLKANLAKQLIEHRQGRGLTQDQLAKISGIPRSTLANLESGTANPSVQLLYSLAKSLGTSMEALVTPLTPDIYLAKSADLKSTYRLGGDVKITKILPTPISHLLIDKFELKQGAHLKGTPHAAHTREYFHLLAGEMSIAIQGQRYSMGPGDVLSFPGDLPHSYENTGKVMALGVSVVSY